MASKQSLLGKAFNNADSDMISMGPTQGYIRKYIQYIVPGHIPPPLPCES
jgi:hypothetical protein